MLHFPGQLLQFIERAAAALRVAGHKVVTFREPIEALNALETAPFEILITRVRSPIGQRTAWR